MTESQPHMLEHLAKHKPEQKASKWLTPQELTGLYLLMKLGKHQKLIPTGLEEYAKKYLFFPSDGKITLDLTIKEAAVLLGIVAGFTPSTDTELPGLEILSEACADLKTATHTLDSMKILYDTGKFINQSPPPS